MAVKKIERQIDAVLNFRTSMIYRTRRAAVVSHNGDVFRHLYRARRPSTAGDQGPINGGRTEAILTPPRAQNTLNAMRI
jgi:hypothetical protein